MNNDIHEAMDQLIAATARLQTALEQYTDDTDHKINNVTNDLYNLRDRFERREESLRKIAQTLLEG